MGTTQLAPGANVAALRNMRGLSQAALARKAAISLSLLSKIEVGDRTLTPAVAAAIAQALGISLAEVWGRAPVTQNDEALLSQLRSAMRDYDLPRGHQADEKEISAGLRRANAHRSSVDVRSLLKLLPTLLRKSTAHAFGANTVAAWQALADVYSTTYWLAARHRWMDLAEIAVTRQRWAAEQKHDPLGEAAAARDRAGTHLNFGDCEGGLTLIDRAIVAAESALAGERRDIAVGLLNLRGMTLAGRLADKREAAREARRHMRSARQACQHLGDDVNVHGLTFGPRNTFAHELATFVDLGRPGDALRLADENDVDELLSGLPATRVSPTRITMARAQLDVGNRDGALENLSIAWQVAPQLARIHPMGREVFRVIASLHRRSNSRLLELSKISGIEI